MHGDLYAHNILHGGQGQALMGDFGAASFYATGDQTLADALQRLEVRAFGCLLEELLDRCDAQASTQSSHYLHRGFARARAAARAAHVLRLRRFGSWTESTYRANESDFQRIKLRQRVAVNMAGRSTRTEMVGRRRHAGGAGTHGIDRHAARRRRDPRRARGGEVRRAVHACRR
jgi:hypothetical protein